MHTLLSPESWCRRHLRSQLPSPAFISHLLLGACQSLVMKLGWRHRTSIVETRRRQVSIGRACQNILECLNQDWLDQFQISLYLLPIQKTDSGTCCDTLIWIGWKLPKTRTLRKCFRKCFHKTDNTSFDACWAVQANELISQLTVSKLTV